MKPTEKGENWFASRYASDSESGSTFRLLHYPCQKSLNPESVIRAGAHTDYGSMTLLFQKENQDGLEIFLLYQRNGNKFHSYLQLLKNGTSISGQYW